LPRISLPITRARASKPCAGPARARTRHLGRELLRDLAPRLDAAVATAASGVPSYIAAMRSPSLCGSGLRAAPRSDNVRHRGGALEREREVAGERDASRARVVAQRLD